MYSYFFIFDKYNIREKNKGRARHNSYVVVCRGEWNAQARPTDLHALPDFGARKGIPHESLSDQAEADRDGTRALPDGTANQDLVPESANEVEEGDSGDQGAKRAGEASAGAKGSGSGGGCTSAARGWWGTRGGQLGVRPASEPP